MSINYILTSHSVPDIVEQSHGWKGQRWSKSEEESLVQCDHKCLCCEEKMNAEL